MSTWPASKARRVKAALLRIGWSVKRQLGTSHAVLERKGWEDYTFAFHDGDELGPAILAKIAKKHYRNQNCTQLVGWQLQNSGVERPAVRRYM